MNIQIAFPPRENYIYKNHPLMAMILPFLVVGIIIASTILVCSYRAIFGPGTFNRIVAANVIGTKAIVLLIVVGYIIERPHFIDIALMYAVIAFIGTIIIAKYAERGELCSR